MKSLEDQITEIEELDKLRKNARKLLQEALDALTGQEYSPRPRRSKSKNAPRPSWNDPGDDDERALMLRALAKIKGRNDNGQKSRDNVLRNLDDAILEEFEKTAKDLDTEPTGKDLVPTFHCAVVLEALAETHGRALSKPALFCFYVVVRELNEVVSPTWVAGAARAGEEALASAFVTGACARALLALKCALQDTAKVAMLLGAAARQEQVSKLQSNVTIWQKQEDMFRNKSLDVSRKALWPQLAVAPQESEEPDKLLLGILEKLGDVPTFGELGLEGGLPQTSSPPHMRDSTATHFAAASREIARDAVKRLLTKVKEAVQVANPISPEAAGKQIATRLEEAVEILNDLLEPMKQFAGWVTDRQLAAPHLGLRVDAAELVFAAVLLGKLTDWKDPKIKPAFEMVRLLLTPDGRLSSIDPFDVKTGGYRLNVQTLEVTRQLATLVAELEVGLKPEFVKRLMAPFYSTRALGGGDGKPGWRSDPPQREQQSDWWVTALAVDALNSVVRMLDHAINRQVLEHFSVREPSDLKLDLDSLFYPDFGLSATKQKKGKPQTMNDENVAVKLQALRAHAAQGPLEPDPLFSLILYGPPGTGKTTLVEAVAKSANVPLVEITPSDILVGGMEGVERRARHVFLTLSMLTHAVILFDEFDSILQDRAERDSFQLPSSVFEFLTPGMLPKLKRLHDTAKEQRVSYVLATNFVHRLDGAITRQGRFDDKHGIYPPDVISRLGRLLDQLRRGEFQRPAKLIRILDAVNGTKGAPMDQIGKQGWFTAPREVSSNTLFSFITNTDENEIPEVRPEAKYETEKKKEDERRAMHAKGDQRTTPNSAVTENGGENEVARAAGDAVVGPETENPYWKGWKTVDDWDRAFDRELNNWKNKGTTDWGEVFTFLEKLVPDDC